MTNPRLGMFWQDLLKVKCDYDVDDFQIGCYVIDKRNNNVEIDGDPFLKKMLFEASPTIINAWTTYRQSGTDSSRSENSDHVAPPGTKWWLPMLLPGGIPGMSQRTFKLYWSPVMRIVLKERKNLGYDTHRYGNISFCVNNLEISFAASK